MTRYVQDDCDDQEYRQPPPYASGISDPFVYSVCVEGEGFERVISALGGQIWGSPPLHLTGTYLVVLPSEIDLPYGLVAAGGATCRFTYVHRY